MPYEIQEIEPTSVAQYNSLLGAVFLRICVSRAPLRHLIYSPCKRSAVYRSDRVLSPSIVLIYTRTTPFLISYEVHTSASTVRSPVRERFLCTCHFFFLCSCVVAFRYIFVFLLAHVQPNTRVYYAVEAVLMRSCLSRSATTFSYFSLPMLYELYDLYDLYADSRDR